MKINLKHVVAIFGGILIATNIQASKPDCNGLVVKPKVDVLFKDDVNCVMKLREYSICSAPEGESTQKTSYCEVGYGDNTITTFVGQLKTSGSWKINASVPVGGSGGLENTCSAEPGGNCKGCAYGEGKQKVIQGQIGVNKDCNPVNK